MGFKGKGLGKDEQGLRNQIETTVRPKYVGLGYDASNGKMNKQSRELIEGIKIVQWSHCKGKGTQRIDVGIYILVIFVA